MKLKEVSFNGKKREKNEAKEKKNGKRERTPNQVFFGQQQRTTDEAGKLDP